MKSRRLLVLLPVLALAAAGCQGDRELQQELLNYKNDSRFQLELLDRHDQFLKEKMSDTQDMLAKVEASDHQLSRDFKSYASRPGQIKKEIVEDTAQRAQQIAAEELDFVEEVNGKLDSADARFDEEVTQTGNEIADRLKSEGRFFDYVMTAQDSLNLAFARRFDSRPWYESVLGKWTEKEAAATTN